MLLIPRVLARVALVIGWLALLLGLAGPSHRVTAQADRPQHKVVFISGWQIAAALGPELVWAPLPKLIATLTEPYDPRPEWTALKDYLKTSWITHNQRLEDKDFLYYSYSGKYGKEPDGRDDYTNPLYTRGDTTFYLGTHWGQADYASRAEQLEKLVTAFPNATFDLVGHSLGGVTGAYWAGTRMASPIPDPKSSLRRVNSLTTLDSPLQGQAGGCWWGKALLQEIPSAVVSSVADAPGRLALQTIANKADGVVEAPYATLPGVWRNLSDYLGNKPASVGDVFCGIDAHGEVVNSQLTKAAIATAIMSGRIVQPAWDKPLTLNSSDLSAPVRLVIGEPKPPYDAKQLKVRVGQAEARIVSVTPTPVDHLLFVDLIPPQTYAGTGKSYPLTLIVDRGAQGQWEDMVAGAIVYPLADSSMRPPTSSVATATALVVDVSGSMRSSWKEGVKIESAKKAASGLLRLLSREGQAGSAAHQAFLVPFSTTASVVQPLSQDYDKLQASVAALTPNGNTNIGDALTKATAELGKSPAGSQKIIILLTDGQTNEGLGPDAILAGPVAQASKASICIHTVGYGNPGDLNESFLRQVAQTSGCGEYHYATDALQLQNIYIKVRHESSGKALLDADGQIAQGQTTAAQTIQVPATQGELHVTLNWPGSRLDLLLIDPQGRRVDPSYPGASLFTDKPPVYAIIRNPTAGAWSAQAFGADVPEGVTSYSLVASTRAATTGSAVSAPSGGIPLPPSDSRQGLFLLLGVLLAAAVGAGLVVALRQSPSSPAATPSIGSLLVQTPGQATRSIPLRQLPIDIGRLPGQAVVLADSEVSRRHARLYLDRGALVVADLGSANGVYVNGQRIERQRLQPGDTVRVGQTILTLEWPGNVTR